MVTFHLLSSLFLTRGRKRPLFSIESVAVSRSELTDVCLIYSCIIGDLSQRISCPLPCTLACPAASLNLWEDPRKTDEPFKEKQPHPLRLGQDPPLWFELQPRRSEAGCRRTAQVALSLCIFSIMSPGLTGAIDRKELDCTELSIGPTRRS